MHLPENITQSFNTFAKIIIDMREEADSLEKKFGSTSDLVLRKRRTIASLVETYKALADTFPKLYKGLRMAAINSEAMTIMETRRSLGISWSQAKDMLGLPASEESIKALQSVDDILARITITAGTL